MIIISIFSPKFSFMKYIFGFKEGMNHLLSYIDRHRFSRIFILTDDNTRRDVLPYFENLSKFTNVNFEYGDENKNLETLTGIWNELLENGADRKSLLINLGGGVVTDIGGFAAVTFKRGMSFVHIPTTLLGMVDAAIGGKNGINFKTYKNQIGTIVQPDHIYIMPEFLKTLDKNEFWSGFAEMLKHGLISDELYWEELITYTHTVDNEKLTELIKKSVFIKDKVITEDPYEKGLRKILNFGHTLGHAIETYVNYNRKQHLTHGHAVAIGMVLAVYLSSQLTGLSVDKSLKIRILLNSIYSKLKFDKTEILKIIQLLKHDKKNEAGRVNFVLLKDIGKPVIDVEVPDELIFNAFEFYLEK